MFRGITMAGDPRQVTPLSPDNALLTQQYQTQMGTMMPASYMVAGCLPSVPASSTTLPATACTGTVMSAGASVAVTQGATTIGPLTGGNGTYWLALHADTVTAVAGWTRQTGTSYLWRQAASLPAPATMALLAKITIAGGVITGIEDMRLPASLVRNGTYDVTDPLYGGVADDTTDIGPALRLAIAAAQGQWGSIVRIPQGVYALNSAVTLPPGGGITIQGDGWVAPAAQNYTTTLQPFRGTWLHIRSLGFTPFTIIGTGTTLKDLAFDHDQPAPGPGWQPTAYPYVIDIATPSTCCTPQTGIADVSLVNLFFFKATRGIHQYSVGGWSGGRINIDELRGQFFQVGIFYEFVADVSRLKNIHMWPYWSTDASVFAYQESNMIGMRFYRADLPILENVFFFSSWVGIEFIDSALGHSSDVQAINVGFDKSRIGIYSNQTSLTGQFINVIFNGGGILAASLPTTIGVALEGGSNWLDFVNLEVSNTGSGCASSTGSGNLLTIVNLRCNNFNLSGSGQAGLYTSSGANMVVGGVMLFVTPNGAASYNGNFIAGQFPGGAVFNPAGDFFANTIAGNPTIGFGSNNFLEFLPAANLFAFGATGGTYMTGGVKKYLCIQDGVLTVGTTCP